jgi:mono/diheme cytochrome c family protein
VKRGGVSALLLVMLVGACSSTPTTPDGAEIYATNCVACHGVDLMGAGRAASLEGGSAGASKTDAEYFEAIRSGPGIMPSFRNLTDAQIGAVIVYLRRLQGR